MNAAGLLVSLLLTAIAPLTEDQRVRISTAYDGRDHREEAFAALLENAAAWSEGVGDAPVRLSTDIEAMIADPDEYRGELYRIVGALQQRTRLDRPWQGVWEWFVRDDSGRPVIVYVTGLMPEDEAHFRDGRRVLIYARYYKRIDAVARDGQLRSYAAFVGAHPSPASGAASDASAFSVVLALAALVLVGLVVVLVLVFVAARRQRSRRPARRALPGAEAEATAVDDGGPLPDDPAEALAELRRRAETDQ
jgi:hypothetical protein